MKIEIHTPELERRLREGIQSGEFRDFDEFLSKALDALFEGQLASSQVHTQSGAALVAAMQASPYRDIDLEPGRDRLPVREAAL